MPMIETNPTIQELTKAADELGAWAGSGELSFEALPEKLNIGNGGIWLTADDPLPLGNSSAVKF